MKAIDKRGHLVSNKTDSEVLQPAALSKAKRLHDAYSGHLISKCTEQETQNREYLPDDAPCDGETENETREITWGRGEGDG